MDNELEVMNNDLTMVTKPSAFETALPIAGAAIASFGLGWALCHFVIDPLIAKNKAKKEEAKTEVKAEEPKE